MLKQRTRLSWLDNIVGPLSILFNMIIDWSSRYIEQQCSRLWTGLFHLTACVLTMQYCARLLTIWIKLCRAFHKQVLKGLLHIMQPNSEIHERQNKLTANLGYSCKNQSHSITDSYNLLTRFELRLRRSPMKWIKRSQIRFLFWKCD